MHCHTHNQLSKQTDADRLAMSDVVMHTCSITTTIFASV